MRQVSRPLAAPLNRESTRRGNTRKRGSIASSGAIDSRVKEDSTKGGGEKWLKMASAMDAALERMRAAWQWIEDSGIPIAHKYQDESRDAEFAWRTLQEEVTAVAKILQIGLKAR